MDFEKRCVHCKSKWTYVFSRLSIEDGPIDIDFRIAFDVLWRRQYRRCLSCRQEQFIKKVRIKAKAFLMDKNYVDNLRDSRPDS